MTPREVVNKMLTAWNQADRDTYMAVCDPDVVIDGVQRGPVQWAADYDTLHEAFRDCKIEVGKGEGAGGGVVQLRGHLHRHPHRHAEDALPNGSGGDCPDGQSREV
jgi:hypothetical protein